MEFVVEKLVGHDGSKFIGTTRNGQPSGLGTCIWPDESQYDGEWRDGYMHGFGTYVWKSGQRYDGEWKVSGIAVQVAVAPLSSVLSLINKHPIACCIVGAASRLVRSCQGAMLPSLIIACNGKQNCGDRQP
jgi:hypothetical protein